MSMTGRVALVTGGTRGIGAAIVDRFARAGATVVFCGRNGAEGRALRRRLMAEGQMTTFITCDVTREAAVVDLIRRIVDGFGRLDVVVNNAGITAVGTVEETTLATWQKVMDANLATMFLVSKHAIPALRRSGGGAIVNLGSTYGVVGAPGSGAYAASKAAAMNFTKTLALELVHDGIRVNALCPGATATPMNLDWIAAQPDPAAAMRDLVAKHPIGRLSSPEEQAEAALFLASDASSYMTGHALLVDGGRTIA